MSHRKSSRGKKSGGSDINFVFTMGNQAAPSAPQTGALSPNPFNMSGTPSGASSPFGFNSQSSISNQFGSANVTPTASPHQSPAMSPVRRTETFVFGSPNTSGVVGLSNATTPTSPFGHGAQFPQYSSNHSVASTPSSFGRGISDIPGLPETENTMFGSESPSRAAPSFSFSQPQGFGHTDSNPSQFSISSPLTSFNGFGQQQQKQHQHQHQQSLGPDDMETSGSGTSPPTQSGSLFAMPNTSGPGFSHGSVTTPPPTTGSGFNFGKSPALNNQNDFTFGSPALAPSVSNATFNNSAPGTQETPFSFGTSLTSSSAGLTYTKASDNVPASSPKISPFGTTAAHGGVPFHSKHSPTTAPATNQFGSASISGGFMFGGQKKNNAPEPNLSFGSKSNSPNIGPSSSGEAFTLNKANKTPTISMSESPGTPSNLPSGGFTFGSMVPKSNESNIPRASSTTKSPPILATHSNKFGSSVAGSNDSPAPLVSSPSANLTKEKYSSLFKKSEATPTFTFEKPAKKTDDSTAPSAKSTSDASSQESKKEHIFSFGSMAKISDNSIFSGPKTTTESPITKGDVKSALTAESKEKGSNENDSSTESSTTEKIPTSTKPEISKEGASSTEGTSGKKEKSSSLPESKVMPVTPKDNAPPSSATATDINEPSSPKDSVTTASTFFTKSSTSSTTTSTSVATTPTFTFGQSNPPKITAKSVTDTKEAQLTTATTTPNALPSLTAPIQKRSATAPGSPTLGDKSNTSSSTSSTTAQSTPVFSFGIKPASPKITSATATPGSPVFNFGTNPASSKSASAADTPSTPTFSFGTKPSSPKTTSSATVTPSVPSFTFGKTPSTSSFSFGASPSSPKSPPPTATPSIPKFDFGSKSNLPKNTSTTASTSVPSFTFGNTPTPSTSFSSAPPSGDKAPSFTLGSKRSNESSEEGRSKPAQFSFNAPKPSTPPSATKAAFDVNAFSFGAPPTSSGQTSKSNIETPKSGEQTSVSGNSPSTFSFGKTEPAVTPSTSSTSSTPSTPSTPANTFMFGSKSGAQTSTVATTPVSTASTPSFSFGDRSVPTTSTTSSPLTLFSSGTKAGINPGTTTATTTAEPPASSTASTSSTASASAPTATTPIPSFTFGDKNNATSNLTTTSSTSSATPVTTAGSTFSFGFGSNSTTSATTPVNTTPSLTTSTASTTTISAPAVPAGPRKPNPFSFSAILDDINKAAMAVPSHYHVSLVPHLPNGQRQGQVTIHTNFRIDNIKPSTRFSELPDAAQRELEELEKYVRGESQRCDYLMNHSGPQHAKMMEITKANINSLSQQLDAMSIGLKGQLATAESLFETAKEQLRHAADGRAIIEAYKNPGSNARWLFGYSPENDYFVTLSKHLNERFEEYKRCILEIERTTGSWAENKAKSPQDIARIIKSQKEAFLALATRVASLHEDVNKQKAYYAQCQRLYS